MGRFVRLDDTVDEIVRRRQYPAEVVGVAAEAAVLAALMAAALDNRGAFKLQFQTDGAVSLLVVDVAEDGKIRAAAQFDQGKIEKIRNPNEKYRLRDGETLPAPHWLGSGHMAFTVDRGEGAKPCQGVVAVKGKDLAEVAAGYYRQSAQIDTFFKLFVGREGQGKRTGRWRAAGIMLQKLPGTPEEAWEEATVFAQSLEPEEALAAEDELPAEKLLHRLYHGSGLEISKRLPLSFGCRCSRGRVLAALKSFDPAETAKMADGGGKIIVDCNFCGEKYAFDTGEISTH